MRYVCIDPLTGWITHSASVSSLTPVANDEAKVSGLIYLPIYARWLLEGVVQGDDRRQGEGWIGQRLLEWDGVGRMKWWQSREKHGWSPGGMAASLNVRSLPPLHDSSAFIDQLMTYTNNSADSSPSWPIVAAGDYWSKGQCPFTMRKPPHSQHSSHAMQWMPNLHNSITIQGVR